MLLAVPAAGKQAGKGNQNSLQLSWPGVGKAVFIYMVRYKPPYVEDLSANTNIVSFSIYVK